MTSERVQRSESHREFYLQRRIISILSLYTWYDAPTSAETYAQRPWNKFIVVKWFELFCAVVRYDVSKT
jgi:hypothetical protein